MNDPADRARNHPFVAAVRSWWFGGELAGVRYEGSLRIAVLDPGLPDPPERLLLTASSEPGAPPLRTQVEVWEGEGGAVPEEARRRE